MGPFRCVALTLFAAVAVCAQDKPASGEDPWKHLRIFAGKWTGAASGEPGKGTSTRQFQFEMGGRYFAGRNRTVYDPPSPGAKPEEHEDYSIFSYDRSQKTIVLRQFHWEGFVNEYTLTSVRENGKELEFVTARIENMPRGWRAKEVYKLVSPDEIVETFSLSAPGKFFAVYSETRLRRVKE